MKAPVQQKELLEEGNYVATVYRIIYIGTVKGEYQGIPNEKFQVDITWELPTETKVWKEGEEAKPVVISKQYTLSLGSKANLRPIVEGIVGGMSDSEAVNFDLDEILGKSCLLNIGHGTTESGKGYYKVTTSKLLKGMEPPKPFNEQKVLSFEKWDENFYLSLPDWLRTKIAETPEYKTLKGVETGEVKNTEDIPF